MLRTQTLDPDYLHQQHPSETISSVAMTMEAPLDTVGIVTADWCTGADDWDDDDDGGVSIATTEPVTMVTVDPDITTSLCSTDKEVGRQSNSVSMVTEDNSIAKLVGTNVSYSDEYDVMEALSGGKNETALRNAVQRLQCLQLEDSEEWGKGCGKNMEQGKCCVVDDSILDVNTDSVTSNVTDPQLQPSRHTGPCSIDSCDSEKDTTLLQGERGFVSYYVSVVEEPNKESARLKHERHLLTEYSTKEGIDLESLADMYVG